MVPRLIVVVVGGGVGVYLFAADSKNQTRERGDLSSIDAVVVTTTMMD